MIKREGLRVRNTSDETDNDMALNNDKDAKDYMRKEIEKREENVETGGGLIAHTRGDIRNEGLRRLRVKVLLGRQKSRLRLFDCTM